MKSIMVFILAAMLLLSACAMEETPEKLPESTVEVETPADAASKEKSEPEETWRGNFAPELVSDIETAFEEIGEAPSNIVSVEYISVRETDLFDRRDYKVSFDKGELNEVFSDSRPWVHAVEYRITTEEWHEGEPEREQYPREYLVTIKFWSEDNDTNINQWSHTGNGELQ